MLFSEIMRLLLFLFSTRALLCCRAVPVLRRHDVLSACILGVLWWVSNVFPNAAGSVA
jgi:hypothetical protein